MPPSRPRRREFVVVGGGVVGASAAWELARRGREVLLIEREAVGCPNPLSSSGDRSKVFRHAYGPDPLWPRLCAESLKLWRRIEAESGESLYVRAGFLAFGRGRGSWARASARVLARLMLPHELLGREEAVRSFPLAAGRGWDHALLDREAGFLRAQRAVKALGRLARRAGAEVWEGCEVRSVGERVETARGPVEARAVIVAAGAWGPALVPALARRTFVTRQSTAYLRPADPEPWRPGRLPCLISFEDGFYVLPLHPDGTVKIADHRKLRRADPRRFARTVEPGFLAACRGFLRDTVPGLAAAPVVETRVCLYTNTADEDFALDRRGGLVVASACSGHGFKLGPLSGRMAAELALGRRPRGWSPRFRLF